MNQEAKIIMLLLEQYLNKYPTIRFGQALSNLGINIFYKNGIPEDIFYDTDKEILDRVVKSLEQL